MSKYSRVVAIIAVMVVVLGVYFVILGGRGIDFIKLGGPVNIGLGIGVLILPLLGLWIVAATLRAGFRHQHLARRIHDENLELDVEDLPRLPSGRIERGAADSLFADVKDEYEKSPDDWRTNYRLARAYDYAGDRGRAREIMRRAVELERIESA
ncbi:MULTISPECIES: hypothetical protein [Nocardiaceae]|uniref:Tetratricopeptide repeat protein n=1 Tax=Rhodococcoides corynebacterioides TaxID=53972 RepID=A0ABS2KTA4_9NOCA|nr:MULTISPECIES: hypothetical protein [Rhodococcus]MBM7414875.1 hypothetical protein [Rhodococcus corynebacterioides]MBP1117337.1 hypothetical protein [Rhodococcus sp. PvP016]